MKFGSRAALLALPALVLVLVAHAAETKRPSSTPAAAPAPPRAAAPSAPAPVPAAESDDEALDAVAATVNDEVVLVSDVEEQVYLFLQRTGQQPQQASDLDTLRKMVLEQLIDEKLILAEAKRQNLTAPEAEVNRQVEAAIADAKERLGGERQYLEQLQRENMTEARLREKYRSEVSRQLIEQRLVEKMVPRRKVPPAEAEAYFNAHKERFPKVPGQVRLAVIQIPPAPESAAVARGRARIELLRKRIVGGEKFAKVAAEASEDPSSARSGGDLGFFRRGQLEPAMEKVAFEGKLGVLSAPVQTSFGWHLVEPIERDTVKSLNGRDSLDAAGKPVLEAHARHILVRVAPEEADVERARVLAERVRAEAAKGADYATLVRRYSKYVGPADETGDVGFVSLGNLQPQIRAGLDTLEAGQVSEVLVNQSGFNIFKLVDRKPERDYTLEEIRAELPDAVGQLQFREKYEAWVKTLRTKAQIDIKSL